jgi:hypothetical protein
MIKNADIEGGFSPSATIGDSQSKSFINNTQALVGPVIFSSQSCVIPDIDCRLRIHTGDTLALVTPDKMGWVAASFQGQSCTGSPDLVGSVA